MTTLNGASVAPTSEVFMIAVSDDRKLKKITKISRPAVV